MELFRPDIVLPIDTESRARLFRQKPVIYTRFIFNSLVEAIANCVKLNKNLTVLKLEGLPLQDSYIECIAQSLASNDCLKEVSFQKSYIGDKGCEAVCGTVKYLNHVEIFNVSECNISPKGAEYVADMIKVRSAIDRTQLNPAFDCRCKRLRVSRRAGRSRCAIAVWMSIQFQVYAQLVWPTIQTWATTDFGRLLRCSRRMHGSSVSKNRLDWVRL